LSSEARDKGTFWTSLFEAVKPYEYDFPTAILFSSDSGKSAMRKCKLEWTIGYSDDHPAIPKDLSLDQDYSLARAILESSKGGTVTLFRQDDGVLPDSLYKDIEHRGFGDPCRALIIIPITIYDDSISGFLIMSLNTRRPYDAEYQEWIEVFSNLLGTSAASVALYEEEVRNRKRQEEEAAKDHKALSAEVAVLTQEASDVAEKLQNLHDIANGVGLGYFEFDIDGRLMYANVSTSLHAAL
jgi:transcriptional regulator with GAF, ATPase, and Fis domain